MERRSLIAGAGSGFVAGVAHAAWARPHSPHTGSIIITNPPYNAVGDGTTDNTAAIQQALSDAGASGAGGAIGDAVIVPKGVFGVKGTLKVPNKVWFHGDSPVGSMILALSGFSGTDLITNKSQDGTQEFCFVSDLSLGFASGVSFTNALRFSSVFINSYIRNCVVLSPGVGIRIESQFGCGPVLLENNWVVDPGGDGIQIFALSGNSNACCGFTLIGNATEHSAAGHANLHINAAANAVVESVGIYGHHFEQGLGGGNFHMLCDGAGAIGGVDAHNLSLLSGGSFLAAGIKWTNVYRGMLRAVENPNLISPILSDTLNGVSITGGVHLPWYNTPDIAMRVGTKTITVP